jgi:Lipid A 3-O-deacylase (PagL)
MKAAAFVLLCTVSLLAQTPDQQNSANPLQKKGTWDAAVWTSGGHSITGGVSGVGAFSAGFRVGKILTIWNFSVLRNFTPFVELGGGLLFTTADVPPFTSAVNFTPQFAVGVHLFTRKRRSLSLAGRYLHISNAGLGDLNPGINTFQFTLGYHWFR